MEATLVRDGTEKEKEKEGGEMGRGSLGGGGRTKKEGDPSPQNTSFWLDARTPTITGERNALVTLGGFQKRIISKESPTSSQGPGIVDDGPCHLEGSFDSKTEKGGVSLQKRKHEKKRKGTVSLGTSKKGGTTKTFKVNTQNGRKGVKKTAEGKRTHK